MVKLMTFIVMCKAYGSEPTIDLLRLFLNLGLTGYWLILSNRGGANVPKALTKPITHLEPWKGSFFFIENKIIPSDYPELLLEENKLDKNPLKIRFPYRSFMIQGIDGEFNFLPKGGLDDSLSVKSVNNGILVVNTKPISTAHPSTFDENVICSGNAPHENDHITSVGLSKPYDLEADNISKADGKIKHVAGSQGEGSRQRTQKFPSAKELKDATNCHWVISHVTLPSWKQHLREISLEQLCDIHDRAYMRQAVLDNVLNSRTRELISILHKARASYDAIRKREVKKDKAYVELEKKCNEALQDLDKNPLVSDMRFEIKAFAKAAIVTKVVPDAAVKLIQSDEMGIHVVKLVKASMFHGRCATFEEVANLKEPFILEKMHGYRPSLKE
ncbi:hypothetical protein Tco_0277488 [Tanacetum coccineum]